MTRRPDSVIRSNIGDIPVYEHDRELFEQTEEELTAYQRPIPVRKLCTKCRYKKILSEFNRNAKAKDGLQHWCRSCQREYNATPERRAAIKKSGAANRAEVERRYRRSSKGRKVRRTVDRRRRREVPEKMRAKDKVKYAIKTGRLVRQQCEKCGKPAQAHHDDYSKPLEVRWLCNKHHREEHGL